MHILIVGAGLAGVTASWYLREAGHTVTVLERHAAPAEDASFANGGQISISHPEPWANPGAPLQVLRWLGRADAPLRFRWPAEPARIAWGLRFLRECLPGRTHRNTLAIARLAAYSGSELRLLRDALGLHYDERSRGVLHLYFARSNYAHGEAQQRVLSELGIGATMLDPAQCVTLEPALAGIAPRLVGGMHGTQDESGDAHAFAAALAARAAQAGVEFLYDTDVEDFELDGARIRSLRICRGGERSTLGADAVVVAAGAWSTPLLRKLGVRLSVYPVKGYSVTLGLQDAARAPAVSLTDESRRIVCSRLGERLRIAGTAELNGYDTALDGPRGQGLLDWVEEMFPGACRLDEPNHWAGLRPTTPSNLPLIGRGHLENLYCNTGHGTLGWTLACGSAHALADLISGREPAVTYPFLGRPLRGQR